MTIQKTETKEIPIDKSLIAYCGLYCGACRAYRKGKCPGCQKNTKATWCKVRLCCIENNYLSCADCAKTELKACKKFNNPVSKIFALVFRSDRNACIARIKEVGYEVYAEEMAKNKMQTIKK
ncbi:MAG: DUF3795 domain-containing protein [Bacteroidota bacterium]|nr:DUF3795 domain-containing protein [Bacteroidota bacterium]